MWRRNVDGQTNTQNHTTEKRTSVGMRRRWGGDKLVKNACSKCRRVKRRRRSMLFKSKWIPKWSYSNPPMNHIVDICTARRHANKKKTNLNEEICTCMPSNMYYFLRDKPVYDRNTSLAPPKEKHTKKETRQKRNTPKKLAFTSVVEPYEIMLLGTLRLKDI